MTWTTVSPEDIKSTLNIGSKVRVDGQECEVTYCYWHDDENDYGFNYTVEDNFLHVAASSAITNGLTTVEVWKDEEDESFSQMTIDDFDKSLKALLKKAGENGIAVDNICTRYTEYVDGSYHLVKVDYNISRNGE